MSPAAPSRTAPLALWRIAEAFLQIFVAAFGQPERIAAQHTLTHKSRERLLSWLRAGEALLRCLLLIEAAAIIPSNAPTRPSGARQRERKLMSFAAEQPEKWRVSFRCFMERGRPRPHLCAEQTRAGTPALHKRLTRDERWRLEYLEPPRAYSAWPLAERVEAMLRVVNNPAPYAKRLARRLHREPARAQVVLKHTAQDRELIGGESFDQIRDAAYAALKPPNSS